MWMDAYVQEILIRQHIAEAQRIAARHHFLSRAKPTLPQVVRAAVIPRIARRIVRMAFP